MSAEHANQLDAAIADYLRHIEANGEPPERESFLSGYSEVCEGLTSFVADYERMHQALRQGDELQVGRVFADSVTRTLLRRESGTEQGLADRDTPLIVRSDTNPVVPESDAEALPRDFGDYRLKRLIARGGMGVVYEAHQMSLNRTVAVKMILSGQLADEVQVKRFFREAQAAGGLDHNGIVPVYEVGSHDSQHYFSMALVEGGSLAEEIANGPLDERIAAAYMRDIAQAVDYAHKAGVIHRDLKPGNVLLDKSGAIRVTDFGLATCCDEAGGVTQTGQILGTPAYMPPEQVVGTPDEITPAADIYALGAVMYSLLTGRPPFQAAHPVETLRQVIEEDPVPPRELNTSISEDLQTICLKCLEKEPAKRYRSADELGNDIDRFLRGEPIRARAASRIEKFRKWVKRNKTVAALSAAAVVSLLVGTVTSVWFAVDASNRAQAEKIAAEQAADLAADNEKLAQNKTQVLDFLTQKVFGFAQPEREKDRSITFREVLDRTTEDALANTELAPDIKGEILNELGKIHFDVSEYDRSLELFDASWQTVSEGLSEKNPVAMKALDQKGMVLIRLEKFADAEEVLKRAWELQTEVLGEDHEDTIHSLAKLGDCYSKSGNTDEGIRITKQVLAQRRRLFGDEYRFVLVSMNGLALLYQQLDRDREAVDVFREIIPIAERTLGEEHPSTATYLNNLALSLMAIGELDESQQIATRVLKLRQEIYEPTHTSLFATRHTLCLILRKREQWEECSVETAKLLNDYPKPSIRHGVCQYMLALCLIKLDREDEARAALQTSIDVLRDILGDDHKFTKQSLDLLEQLDGPPDPPAAADEAMNVFRRE